MNRLSLILLGLVAAGFGLGVIHLFNLRLETGDNYPPYSSLRADPLGSKAICESLNNLLPAGRHYRVLSKLGNQPGTTLFWLGENAERFELSSTDFEALDNFMRWGGRLVIAFTPILEVPRTNRFLGFGPRGRPFFGPAPTNAPATNPSKRERFRTGAEHWGYSAGYTPLARSESDTVVPRSASCQVTNEEASLPETLLLHTTFYFDKLGPEWRRIYAAVNRTNLEAAVVERRFGRGTLVLCADAFPFSNEALFAGPQPSLLSWFVGPARRVLFDETHLGVNEEPGVATLAKKYHLQGFFFALLVLAGLYLWKNSGRFVAPIESAGTRGELEPIEGKDAASGFVNLLRRSIPPAEIMKVCLEEWNTHADPARRPSLAQREEMQRKIEAENAREPRQRNSITLYHQFYEILNRRR